MQLRMESFFIKDYLSKFSFDGEFGLNNQGAGP